MGTSPRRARGLPRVCLDVDGDGDDDLLLHFDAQALTDLTVESTSATIVGVTTDGTPFRGEDSVKIGGTPAPHAASR